MEKSKHNTLYIYMPANFSGDLWHVAAALILAQKYGSEDVKWDLAVAVGCSKCNLTDEQLQSEIKNANDAKAPLEAMLNDKSKPLSKDDQAQVRAKIQPLRDAISGFEQVVQERKFGSVSFNYFHNLGLNPVLFAVDGTKFSKKNLDAAMLSSLPDEGYDKFYDAQKGSPKLFMDMHNDKSAQYMWSPEAPKVNQLRVLPLMSATTIAVNFLYHRGDGVDKDRFNYMRHRMWSINNPKVDAPIEKEAEDRYQKLLACAKEALAKKNEGGDPYKRVMLENYRWNRNNWQTNSNSLLSKFLKKHADAHSMAVIKIPAIGDLNKLENLKKEPGATVFDFYGLVDKIPYPGVEARVQSCFWGKVADNPLFAGIFGGRSGSIDIAGFSGMNAFFWDEPWIAWSVGQDESLGPNNKPTRSDAQQQVTQCLRSLQLLAIMAVGVPVNRVADPADNTRPVWSEIRENEFKPWLDRIIRGEHNFSLAGAIYPKLNKITEWRLSGTLDEWIFHDMEGQAAIHARVLDLTGYRSEISAPSRDSNKSEKP